MKLTILKGLPASGKSTICQGLILADEKAIRINKDLLRKMLHFGRFSPKNEEATADAAQKLARNFLKNNNVIIDDTNLNPKTMKSWKDLAEQTGSEVEVIDMTEVPVEDCILRDANRDESVGAVVIKNMAIQYGIKEFIPDSVVLCDIDGTIADMEHRLHFIQKPENAPEDWKKDWKGFFTHMENDIIRQEVQKILIQFHNEGKTVIFITARPENFRDTTLNWLASNFLTFGYTLMMRSRADRREDTIVKKELFEKYFPNKEVIHVAIDDRPRVLKMWEEMGIPVIDVGKGIEF